MKAQNKIQATKVRPNGQKGFSLIELLIVVAVILILAAIAIPNFIKSRMRANEAAAVHTLRNISTAEVGYATTYGIGFADSLVKLGGTGVTVDQNAAGLIDEVLASGIKGGYVLTYTVLTSDSLGQVTSYAITADPLLVGSTGQRHFYADQSGVIRSNDTATAGATDPPL